MKYSSTKDSLMFFFQNVGDCTYEQILRFFRADLRDYQLDYLLTRMESERLIRYDHALGRIHWCNSPRVANWSLEFRLYALWLISDRGNRRIREVRMLPYPTEYLFITTENVVYDITVVENRSIAYAARSQWRERNVGGVEDETIHIAVCFNEEMAEEIAEYEFDSFCILDDDHRPIYGTWDENNRIIPINVAKEKPDGENVRRYFGEQEHDEFYYVHRREKARDYVRELKSSLQNTEALVSKLDKMVNQEIPISYNGDYERAEYDWIDGFTDSTCDVAEAIRNIYQSFRRIVNFFPSENPKQQQQASDSVATSFGVKAAVIDGVIVIKTPLVASGQNAKRFGGSTRILTAQLPIFADEIREKIAPLIKEGSRKYRTKTLCVLNVYGPDEINIPDADNVLVKHQTDAITSMLPGGDSYDGCAFYFQTIRREHISEGTYFFVIDGFGNALTTKKMEILIGKL